MFSWFKEKERTDSKKEVKTLKSQVETLSKANKDLMLTIERQTDTIVELITLNKELENKLKR